MKIGIVVPTLTEGDAVSIDALSMAEILRAEGNEVDLFALRNTSRSEARPLSECEQRLTHPNDLLLYHHQIGFPAGVRLVETLPCDRRIVKYHNVTPVQFFGPEEEHLARACQQGRDQLPALARSATEIWADSQFNAQDFQDLEAPIVRVLPPFHQTEQLMARPADSRGILGFDESVPIVLMVGRVVPNKNHLLALQAFAEFLQQGGRARLVIAGDATSPAYRDQIVCTAQRLGIAEQIFLTGKIRSDQLKALYLLADLLLVTSDHEGFCVPLLEAMRFHVPIVAVPRAAVPETAGPAACYAEHAHDLAAQMKTLRENRRLGEALRHAGRERYEAYFHPRVLADRFRALVRGLPFDQTPGEDHREDQRDAVRRPDSGQHRDAAIASHAAAGE